MSHNFPTTSIVTGGAGFIGSHLVDRLVQRGDRVLVVDDMSTGCYANVREGATILERSVNDPKLKQEFKAWNPQVVFHLAAQVSVSQSVRSPELDAQTNILGSLNVLSATQDSGCPRLIFASSGGAVYGEPDYLPVTEDHPIRPVSPYGVSKAAFELYAKSLSTHKSTDVTVLRLGNVYGPRQRSLGEAGVVSIFTDQILNGRPVSIFGDGTDERDYVYVSDVVDAMLKASDQRESNVFNVGTGIGTSTMALFLKIVEIIGIDGKFDFRDRREGDIRQSRLDCSKVRACVGWKSKVALDTGLQETIEYLRSVQRR